MGEIREVPVNLLHLTKNSSVFDDDLLSPEALFGDLEEIKLTSPEELFGNLKIKDPKLKSPEELFGKSVDNLKKNKKK